MKIESPCLGCEERELGCHNGCGNYIAFRAKVDAAHDMIFEAEKKDQVVWGHIMDTSTRIKRRQKGGGR